MRKYHFTPKTVWSRNHNNFFGPTGPNYFPYNPTSQSPLVVCAGATYCRSNGTMLLLQLRWCTHGLVDKHCYGCTHELVGTATSLPRFWLWLTLVYCPDDVDADSNCISLIVSSISLVVSCISLVAYHSLLHALLQDVVDYAIAFPTITYKISHRTSSHCRQRRAAQNGKWWRSGDIMAPTTGQNWNIISWNFVQCASNATTCS